MELLCKIFGHKYVVYAKPKKLYSKGIRWLNCSRCGRQFVINDKIKCIIPMDFELMDFHDWEEV